MTIEQAKIFSNGQCDDSNNLGYHALKTAIHDIKRQLSICDELSDDLKIKGWEYLQECIKDLHKENKNILGFDIDKSFSDDDIKEQISGCEYEYLEYFKKYDTADFHYDWDEQVFVDSDGKYFSDEMVLDSEYCHEQAIYDLEEMYREEHPHGSEIDGMLRSLQFECEGHIARFRDKQDFIKKIEAKSLVKQDRAFLVDFIIKNRESVLRFIDAELSPCTVKQGKLIAMIIVVLRDCGYFVQTDRKLTQIHKAFCEKYPGKIGQLTGIVDYINSHDNPEYDGDKQIREDELKLLQSKLENFVE